MHHGVMRLDIHIAAKDVSVRSLARAAGVAHTTVLRLLRGLSCPDRKTLSRIAGATGGEVSEADVLASFGAWATPQGDEPPVARAA